MSTHVCTTCNIEFDLRLQLKDHMAKMHESLGGSQTKQPRASTVQMELAAPPKPKIQPIKIVKKVQPAVEKMEPETPKFDETMIEDYNEDEVVEDECLEEMLEAKPVKTEIKDEEKPGQLWGEEADRAWYATSKQISARFRLRDVPLSLGREAFRSQGEWLAYVCPYLRAASPGARPSQVLLLARAKWFEARRSSGQRIARGRKILLNTSSSI